MTFNEFLRWCNERACDGMWSFDMAISSCDMIDEMRKTPFWKRRKMWKALEPYAVRIVEQHKQHCGAKMDGETDD